jgi:hypothetical protein
MFPKNDKIMRQIQYKIHNKESRIYCMKIKIHELEKEISTLQEQYKQYEEERIQKYKKQIPYKSVK